MKMKFINKINQHDWISMWCKNGKIAWNGIDCIRWHTLDTLTQFPYPSSWNIRCSITIIVFWSESAGWREKRLNFIASACHFPLQSYIFLFLCALFERDLWLWNTINWLQYQCECDDMHSKLPMNGGALHTMHFQSIRVNSISHLPFFIF